MIRVLSIGIGCFIGLLLTPADAQDPLPRVLVITDTVQRPAVQAAARELQGVVRFEYPRSQEPGDTGTALEKMDQLLGDGDWDLVYFNFGFADLHYRDPKTQDIRALSKNTGGIRVSTPTQYADQLEQIVKHLLQTEAKLIWSSTTPIVNPGTLEELYDEGSEIEFNEIAKEIMDRHDVRILDLHGYVMEQVTNEKHPDAFNYHRTLPLHEPIIDIVLKELEIQSGR